MLNPEAIIPEKSFFQKMQEEVKILQNINFILEKLHKEFFFQDIQEIFDKILKNEIVFAIKGKSKLRTEENRAQEAQFRHQTPNLVEHVHFQGEPEDHLQLNQ